MALTNKKFAVWKGTYADYSALTKDADTAYFITTGSGASTGMLYVGTNTVGCTYEDVSSGPFPTANQRQGVIYVGQNYEMRYWNGTAWANMSLPIATAVSSSSTDVQIPTALAVYTYVNTVVTGMGKLRPAVQDITSLKDLTTHGDKDLILVEDKGSLYRYDAQNSDAGDDDTVVKPNDIVGSGRWLKMMVAGTVTAGNGISVTGSTVSVNADTTVFEFDSTTHVLKIKDVFVKKDEIPVRKNSTAYALNDRVMYPGKYSWVLKCTTAGTSDSSVPAWPSSITSGTTTITDGTAVFTIYDLMSGTDISGKMDKVSSAVENNLVALDSTGNAKDSGKTSGGDTFASSDTDKKKTLATEYATSQAIEAAKLCWQE